MYFFVDKVGAVRLDDKGFAPVERTKKDYCKQLFVGQDGSAYLVGWGIHKLTAKGKSTLASKAVTGKTIHDFGVQGPGGHIVAGKFRTLYVNNGKKWKQYAHTDIGFKDGALKGAYVDKAGKLFAMTTYALYVLDGDKWKTIVDSAKQKRKIFFSDMDVLPDGKMLFTMSGALAIYDGKTFAQHKTGGFSLKNAQLAPNGQIVVTSFNSVAAHDPEDFSAQAAFELKESGIKASRIDKASMDSQGRLWVATDNGVVILDKNMNPTHWPPGSMPAIAGKIMGVVAVGKGPAKVPEAGEIARGNIKGSLFHGKDAASKIPVEICDLPRMRFRKSPCEDKPFSAKTTTDEKGNFLFKDVPLNAYGIAAKMGAKWSTSMSSKCSGLKAGQTCNLGRLTVRKK